MEDTQAVAASSALAHDARLTAFRRLVQAGAAGIAAGDLAARLAVPPNSLSSDLAILAHAGLVVGQRHGRSMVYRVEYSQMAGLLEFLVEDCCGGSPSVCANLAAIVRLATCCGNGQPA
jgi:DNA-binding transcriptional ArsR family regulator